jgi:uncharacterized protein YjbJ (UPF0337 family)
MVTCRWSGDDGYRCRFLSTGQQKKLRLCSFLYAIEKNKIMKNITELKGSWNETKGKLKQKFAILTDSDVLFIEGKQDEMLGRLQIKLGKSKEEIKKILSEL